MSRESDQAKNWIGTAVQLANELKNLRDKARSLRDSWYGKGLQVGGAIDLDPANHLTESSYDGMDITTIHNFVGSVEALETAFFATHGENIEKMRN